MRTFDEADGAKRLLDGLENGTLAPAEAAILAGDLDPVLIYVVVSFLRASYPASHPAAGSVLERVVRFTTASQAVVRKHGEGEHDPIARWFESEHSYDDFRGRGGDMIALVVDKIES